MVVGTTCETKLALSFGRGAANPVVITEYACEPDGCRAAPLCETVMVYVPAVGASIRTCSTLSRKLSPFVAAEEGLAGLRIQGREVPLGPVTRRSRSFTSRGVVGLRVLAETAPLGSVQQMVTRSGPVPSDLTVKLFEPPAV